MIWKAGGDQEKRKYDFSYDNVNRLTRADFNQKFSSTWAKTDPGSSFNIDYSVDSLPYDANGNILTMQQMALQLGTSIMSDKMTYTYMNSGVSNRLLAVTENGSIGSTDNKLGDFTDKNTSNDDYLYDANGSMISDKNKKIDSIYWYNQWLLSYFLQLFSSVIYCLRRHIHNQYILSGCYHLYLP